MKLVKGDQIKFQRNDKFLAELKKQGWSVEGEKSEREALKEKADALGLKYAKNITDEKLQALIDDNS